MKEWTCTQCREIVKQSFADRLSGGPPEECENCGNTEFDEGLSTGPHHKLLDKVT